MANKNYKLTPQQKEQLMEAVGACDKLVTEMAHFGKGLNEGVMLQEGIVDTLAQKFGPVLQKAGFVGLKKAITAAMIAGSLAGVNTDAIAQAGQKAGLNPQQAQELATANTTQTNPRAQEFTNALNLLKQTYVVSDSEPTVKKNMNFTGDINDVIGIEPKQGFPIFRKGSASAEKLTKAFQANKSFSGKVTAKGQTFPGNFIENDGLYYSAGPATPPAPGVDSTSVNTNTPASNPAAVSDRPNTDKMVDFTGLFKQAQMEFNYAKQNGGKYTLGGKTTVYNNFKDFAFDYVRVKGKGLQNFDNAKLQDLFKDGLRVTLPSGGDGSAMSGFMREDLSGGADSDIQGLIKKKGLVPAIQGIANIAKETGKEMGMEKQFTELANTLMEACAKLPSA